jgi:hypothetical protein
MEKKIKEEKKAVNKDKIKLEAYEKIGNLFYKYDRWGEISLYFSLLFFFLLGYFFIISISPNTPEFFNNYLLIISIFLLCAAMISLVASVLLMYIGIGYAWIKSKDYDKNEVIRLYLNELSSGPDVLRRWEILKHLTYNLMKLKFERKRGLRLLCNFLWRPFTKISRTDLRFKSNVINKVIIFIQDATVFLDFGQYKEILTEIGDCIKQNDYRGITKIFKANKDLLDSIDEIKKETKMIRLRTGLKKTKDYVEWTAEHGRKLIYILMILIASILFFLGKIPLPPIS